MDRNDMMDYISWFKDIGMIDHGIIEGLEKRLYKTYYEFDCEELMKVWFLIADQKTDHKTTIIIQDALKIRISE